MQSCCLGDSKVWGMQEEDLLGVSWENHSEVRLVTDVEDWTMGWWKIFTRI